MLLVYENAKKLPTEKSVISGKRNIVLLYGEKQPKQKWLLGKFVGLIPSQHARVLGVLLGKSRNTYTYE